MSYVNTGSVLAIGVTFVVTSIAAVATRFSIRLRHDTALGADDWLSLAAMVSVRVQPFRLVKIAKISRSLL